MMERGRADWGGMGEGREGGGEGGREGGRTGGADEREKGSGGREGGEGLERSRVTSLYSRIITFC